MRMKNNELATSFGNIAKVPTGLNRAVEMGFKKVLNFGCGLGYKFHAEALKGKIELINYDPYIPEVAGPVSVPFDTEAVFCNNVLNVIEDIEDIKKALEQMKAPGLPVYITIYEGDKTGAGRVTSRGTYQRNQKARDYIVLKEAGFTFKKGMWYHENSSK